MKEDSGPPGEGRDGPEGLGSYLRYVHLGTQMVLLLLLGIFGGVWLDGKLGSSPAFILTGSVLGIGLSMAVVIRETGRKDS